MNGKRPAVKGFTKAGSDLSHQWSLDFPEAEALAFMSGARTKIMPIDIDSPDEDLRRDTEKRYGPTPIMVRTPSGGTHLWYLHNGESRQIRPDPSVPVDILGTGGLAIAPPSMGTKGRYQFIRGGLADLHKLRPAANLDQQARQLIQQGGRNKALLDYLRNQARHADDLETLIDVAQTFADQHLDRTSGHAFTDAEIRNVAKSVHDWTQRKIGEGQYFVGTGRYFMEGHDKLNQVMALGPYACALFLRLKVRAGGLKSFQIANDMRHDMPDGVWPLRKMQDARKALTDAGIIKEKHRASSFYGTTVYEWA